MFYRLLLFSIFKHILSNIPSKFPSDESPSYDHWAASAWYTSHTPCPPFAFSWKTGNSLPASTRTFAWTCFRTCCQCNSVGQRWKPYTRTYACCRCSPAESYRDWMHLHSDPKRLGFVGHEWRVSRFQYPPGRPHYLRIDYDFLNIFMRNLRKISYQEWGLPLIYESYTAQPDSGATFPWWLDWCIAIGSAQPKSRRCSGPAIMSEALRKLFPGSRDA